jgi:nitroreductase
MQPYRVVLVSDPEVRARLADAMLGGNGARVLAAPLTAVFAADLQPMREMEALQQLERDAGKPPRYLRNLAFDASVLTTGGCEPAQHAKSGALGLASALLPMPSVSSAEAWAFKNAMLAAQTYMLAATAHGLGTYPMEGFDGRRVRDACGIPSRYGVPVVIPTGYAAAAGAPAPEGEAAAGAGAADGAGSAGQAGGATDGSGADAPQAAGGPSPRFAPERVFRLNAFDAPVPPGLVPRLL